VPWVTIRIKKASGLVVERENEKADADRKSASA
jgi:hypothetical protein